MSILTYNPKAKPGDADYWGDVYGDNSTNNQLSLIHISEPTRPY